MIKTFDMELFLGAVQLDNAMYDMAKIIQAEIAERWQLQAPWTWKRKHVAWFLEHRMSPRSAATRY